jgi:hypothetical protein
MERYFHSQQCQRGDFQGTFSSDLGTFEAVSGVFPLKMGIIRWVQRLSRTDLASRLACRTFV